MLTALLQTKLYFPRPKTLLVSSPHLLGKLDVRSRTQAIVKADQLRLLNP